MGLMRQISGFVAPNWALSRAVAHHKLASFRGYEGAKHTASTGGWQATGGNANVEIAKAGRTLRDRSRDLVRNNPFAKNAVVKMAAHAVGKGIMPIPQQDDDDENKILNEIWENFNQNCHINRPTTFYALQYQDFKAVVTDGEGFIRWYDMPAGGDCLLKCELLEAQWCDAAKNEATKAGGQIVAGVEFDKNRQIVAYWMFESDPDGGGLFGFMTRSQSVRIDAKFISHIYDADRAGQVRGVPWMASVIIRLRNLDDYQNAELMRKKVAALFGIFLTRPEGDTGNGLLDNKTTDAKGKQKIEISPGMVHELEAGVKPEFISPPMTDTSNYIKDELHAVAAGLGVPYSMLTGDLSQANYSSLREGKLDFWQMLDAWQQFILIPQFNRVAWFKLMEAEERAGNIKFKVNRPTWSTPKRAWVDPLKDGKALQLMLQLGIEDLRSAMAANGHVPSEQIAKVKQTIELCIEAGIPLPWDNTKAAKAANATDDADDNEPDEGDDDEKTKKDSKKSD